MVPERECQSGQGSFGFQVYQVIERLDEQAIPGTVFVYWSSLFVSYFGGHLSVTPQSF